MNKKLNNQELLNFCEQLSIILHSGISSAEGLHLLLDDTTSERSRAILNQLLEKLEETGSMAMALEESGLFPASMVTYVRAGEETGCLDEVMASLAEHYEEELMISSHIRSAVAYPLLMLGMMGIVIVILLVKVLPVFQQVFRQMGMEMGGLPSGLLGIGTVISRYSAAFLILVLALIALLLFFCIHPAGREKLTQIVSRIPRLREIPVAMDYGRLAQGMALGLRSGMDPESSLELAQNLTTHPIVKERLQKTLSLLKEGELFSEAIREGELFQGMDARLIIIGFRAGSADEVMKKMAGRYRENSLAIVQQTLSIVEPTIVIILSLLVGLVLLSVMMPLLGILSDMIA